MLLTSKLRLFSFVRFFPTLWFEVEYVLLHIVEKGDDFVSIVLVNDYSGFLGPRIRAMRSSSAR